MTVEELKVRLCEEIKFNNDGYNNMCEVLQEFSEAQKTAHNSDYAKLPSLHDVMDIVRPNGAGQEIPEIVRRVYETIKKLGNFA